MEILTGEHWRIIVADVIDGLRSLPAGSVHCCVTSPPYWGLRNYGFDGQIGLENSPEEFIATMVKVFQEVRRVLRDDGTLWVNLGDSYSKDSKFGGMSGSKNEYLKDVIPREYRRSGLPNGNLVGIPWRIAFALQADGWVLRSGVCWLKPSAMPESLGGVRWKNGKLKNGSWRPSNSHEFVFQLAKQEKYFCDGDSSKEPTTGNAHSRGTSGKSKYGTRSSDTLVRANNHYANGLTDIVETRNLRSVWRIAAESYKGAHFAAFPTELVRTILSAATSRAGCCSECGCQLAPVIQSERKATRPGTNSKIIGRVSQHDGSPYHDHHGTIVGNRDPKRHTTVVNVTGFRPVCPCNAGVSRPVVLDCFAGSCTTGQVCTRMGCEFIGIEAHLPYAHLGVERINTPWIPKSERKKPPKRRRHSKRKNELFK